MKFSKVCSLFFYMCTVASPAFAVCNSLNLTRCLDSACVQNSGDTGDRCRLCGTDLASGAKNNAPAMKSLSIGSSSKIILSDDDLATAPATAGSRYSWATEKCIKKVDGCTADDVTKNYDSLIEQSCKSVITEKSYSKALSAQNVTKSVDSCNIDIAGCLTADLRCGSDWSRCSDESVYSILFSECSISTGCSDLVQGSKPTIDALRVSGLNARKVSVENITKKYSALRESKIKDANDACSGNGKQICITNICKSMANNCEEDFEDEKKLAEYFCKYVDTACEKLK